MMILFTKTGCERCEWVKHHCDLTDVRVLDVETAEGLALLAYYECVRLAEKPGLPILVVGEYGMDHSVLQGTQEIAEWLGGGLTPAAPLDDCGDACVL